MEWPSVFKTHHDSIPNFAFTPTLRTVRDGLWTDSDIWDQRRIPNGTDVVRIEHEIDYAIIDCEALVIGIGDGGLLRAVAELSTQLTVGTLQVSAGGRLEIGTIDIPAVDAEVIFSTAKPLANDPEQWSNGLIAVGGAVSICGQTKRPYARLAQRLTPNQSVITVTDSIMDWQLGDRLVIPDTRQLHSGLVDRTRQWEEHTLASISLDGLTFMLAEPLRFEHAGCRDDRDGKWHYGHVLNLTRSVKLRSSDPAGMRGHIVLMHNTDVCIRYATLQGLGRTTTAPLHSTTFDSAGNVGRLGLNQIGRYPIHAHHLTGVLQPNGLQYTFEGLAIDGGTAETNKKWGITLHNSHYGRINDNIVYNVSGGGIVTEDGNETENLIIGNFVCRVSGPKPIGVNDGAMGGSGLWLRGGQNRIIGNIAANCTAGLSINMYRLDKINQPMAQGMNPDHAGQGVVNEAGNCSLKQVIGNEIYACYTHGLDLWELGGFGDFLKNPPLSTISDTVMWHIARVGLFEYRSSRLLIDGLTCLGNWAQVRAATRTVGLSFDPQYPTRDMRAQRLNIQNQWTGIDPPGFMLPDHIENIQIFGMLSTTAGLETLRAMGNEQPGTLLIEDAYLRNLRNIAFATPRRDTFTRKTTLRRVRMDRVAAVPVNIGVAWDIVLTLPPSTAIGYGNLKALDIILVEDYNEVEGDNFQVFYLESAPNALMPMTKGNIIGAPMAGLTNAEAMMRYGIAVGGQLALCAERRDGIRGFVCKL